MMYHRSYKFRVYPTAEQLSRLTAWTGALRFLWNLAHEQRLIGLARSRNERVFPTAFQQQRELTDLRAETQWLADVPRHACARLLVELDMAWGRCFGKIARTPRFKRRGVDAPSIVETNSGLWRMSGNVLLFPKLGAVRVVVHRAIAGKATSCTLKADGDQWFAIVSCEVDGNAAKRATPIVAIDRGVTYTLADSDGKLTKNPRHYEAAMAWLARAQRNVSRKKKGSKNREKAKLRVMRIGRKVRRQREHFLHVESAHYAKSHGVVVLEKLNVEGMIRGLGRSIAGAGWSTFATMLRYKLEATGGSLVEVPAQYSSQTCASCGVVDGDSRNRENFRCTTCGHSAHADTNAAMVLLQRFNTPGSPWCLPVEGSLLEGAQRSRKRVRVSRRRVEGAVGPQVTTKEGGRV